MKRVKIIILAGFGILLLATSCKNSSERKGDVSSNVPVTDTTGLILVGRDIITDIELKPDTTGDPWEVEKVKGFNGIRMFGILFENIYAKKLTVYDCRSDKVLTTREIRDLQKEFDSDLSRIGKVQFTEDWYFDTRRNGMIKKIKSVSFGFSIETSGIMAYRYKALFRIRS
ncbi:MAG: hypothetical protein ABR974_08270 [Bacteroidales bacterium]|jgi:hypothetical protein